MTRKRRVGSCLAAGAGICGLAALALGGSSPRLQDQAVIPPFEKTIVVAADAGWVDTGIDVGPGEEIHLSASGEIDLQRGNPQAVCGPGGLDLITVDQPVPHANLGALIGKVVQPIALRVDADSGIEVRDEVFVLFLVGEETAVTVPFKGRLCLGINENVLKDNGGAYTVVVARRPV